MKFMGGGIVCAEQFIHILRPNTITIILWFEKQWFSESPLGGHIVLGPRVDSNLSKQTETV